MQCAMAAHVGDTHTDCDPHRMTINPPHGRPAGLPWLVWRDQAKEADRA